jgi:hypothetical protein
MRGGNPRSPVIRQEISPGRLTLVATRLTISNLIETFQQLKQPRLAWPSTTIFKAANIDKSDF